MAAERSAAAPRPWSSLIVRLWIPPRALKTTPLTAAHIARGGKMVAFGGYSMPVQYPLGILKEHLWTREHAGLFDVSHMGPSFLELVRSRPVIPRPTTAPSPPSSSLWSAATSAA